MPMYYFSLRDRDTIIDTEGTDLVDVAAAREHATGVARELTFKSDGIMQHDWSNWTMTVNDENGTQVFSFGLSGFDNGNSDDGNAQD